MNVHPRADSATSIVAIDHLALRVADRDAMARFLSGHLGMSEVEGSADRTVLASGAGGARLVLREGGEASEPGVLARVVLRVADLEGAVSRLPDGLDIDRTEPEVATFRGPEGLGLGLTSVLGGGIDYDIDHVVLRAMDPDETAMVLAELGFVPRGGALHVGDKQVRVEPNPGSGGEGPALAHIGVRVDSIGAVEAQARSAGVQLDRVGPGHLCVHVRGPEQIRLEYAERSLAPS